MNKPLLLDIKNVTVRREVFDSTVAVFNNLNLQIAQGESLAIIGANGSGKSSLLGLLQGELRPIVTANSHVKILGQQAINIWDFRQQIGMVSHNLQNDYRDDVPAADVLLSGFYSSIGIWSHQSYSQQQYRQVDKIAARLGITHLMRRYYCQLSSGEKRRFILGRALIHKPSTLVFDEPTSGLDIAARQRYLAIIEGLLESGKNMILVTHHIREIPSGISRVVMMKHNQVVADGNKKQLFTARRLSQLFDIDLEVTAINGSYDINFPMVKPSDYSQ